MYSETVEDCTLVLGVEPNNPKALVRGGQVFSFAPCPFASKAHLSDCCSNATVPPVCSFDGAKHATRWAFLVIVAKIY